MGKTNSFQDISFKDELGDINYAKTFHRIAVFEKVWFYGDISLN